MIHVICLNPAIDKFYEIGGFSAGETYSGLTPRSLSGGKGVNVARVLAQLGERPTLYAFLGDGAQALEREMHGLCDCMFIPVDGACRVTINVLDRASGQETVITEAGPTATRADVRQMMQTLEDRINPGDVVVCSGSVIAGAPTDMYAQISRVCKAAGARCALDCNAGTLPRSLENAAYALGKPNERELCDLLGEARTQKPEEIVRLARRLMPPYDALLVSMGAAGGVYVTKDAAVCSPGAMVDVVSTVGSGDACFAGAVYAFARHMNMEETLRIAMACGAANASSAQTGVGGGETVMRMMNSIDVRRV